MDVFEAIRKRKAVRTYTDRPVDDAVLDRLLRAALVAPTGSGAQAWDIVVVRDADRRREVAELVIQGGARYFGVMRGRKEGVSDEEHAAWANGYAEKILSTYRVVPVWIVGVMNPRFPYPDEMAEGGRLDDLISLAFAMENLMLTARAEGLGTVPTTAFVRFEKDRLREILGIPAGADPHIVTPLGHPVAFPEGRPPALQRNFHAWKQLVHDDTWENTRA